MQKHSTNDVAFLFWLTLLAFLLVFALLQPGGRLPQAPEPAPPGQGETRADDTREPAQPQPENCTPRTDCCKVCSKGKACGNACISRSLNCRQPDGCACDAEEVCED